MKTEAIPASGRRNSISASRMGRIEADTPPSAKAPRLQEWLALGYGIVVLIVRAPKWLLGA